MATSSLLLLLFLLLLTPPGPTSACKHCSRARAFLETACRSTRYPQLCVQTLMAAIEHPLPPHKYSNPRALAQLALTASLTRARRARAYLTHAAREPGPLGLEAQALTNCVDQMSSSMDQIGLSIRELGRMDGKGGGEDFGWRTGNVLTWTSAALTYQSTCLDAFPGGRGERHVMEAVRRQVDDVARVTSNALALVNRFVVRHRAGRTGP